MIYVGGKLAGLSGDTSEDIVNEEVRAHKHQRYRCCYLAVANVVIQQKGGLNNRDYLTHNKGCNADNKKKRKRM